MRKTAKYCLSFTDAGLKPELAAVMARIHAESGIWRKTRASVLERNTFQSRSLASAKRLENEDKLGLDQIYMQAKRYSENSVSSEKVQAFVGAMTSGGCRKGVFVTKSKFTADAMRFAESIRDPRLVLVDGDKLANLMIQHGVRIQTKEEIKISKIDLDFYGGGD